MLQLILKSQDLGLPLDLMKSLVKDESLSMLNQSSVFENLLTVYYVISTEWEIYTNLERHNIIRLIPGR